MLALYRIDWTEHERGWGSRPDGSSFHASTEDAAQYVKDYWAKQPDGPAPDEYTSPGRPYLVEITDKKFHKEVVTKKNVMLWQHEMRGRVF